MPGPRIVIVANKWFEADPLCTVLINERARPAEFSGFSFPNYPAARPPKPRPGDPRPADPEPRPRLKFTCATATVEVWCIEDLMNPAESGSSSLEKARVLPAISAAGLPGLVVAFGTAGSREGIQANGSVVIGRRVFTHDPLQGRGDRTGCWTPPQADRIVESDLPATALSNLDERARHAAEARFLKPPVQPADPPLVVLGNNLVALGVVNITNYDDYVWADREAAEAFRRQAPGAQVGSIETTHGVIRAAFPAAFLFVSGITDTEGRFDYQVPPRVYAQNFAAAHNAGVALAWLLPGLAAGL